MNNQEPKYEMPVSELEISKMFGLSQTFLQKDRISKNIAAGKNRIPFVKIGQMVRYMPSKVAEALQRMTVPAALAQPAPPYHKPVTAPVIPGVKRGRGRPHKSAASAVMEGERK